MKRILSMALALIVVIMSVSAFTVPSIKSDFSGTWSLDKGASDLGQFGDYAPYTLEVEQKDDSITINRTAQGFDGNEITISETLPFDGAQVEMTIYGNSKKKALITWNDDQKGFSEKYELALEFNGQSMEVTGTETWTLSEDGKTMTVQNNSSSSFGDMTTKAVYQKK